MEKFDIEPVLPTKLTEIARFLVKCRTSDGSTPSLMQTYANGIADVEHRIRWLLLDNPAANGSEPLGFYVHDRTAGIRGVTLCFPARFTYGEKPVSGLGSGSFFVDMEAHSLGYYLFRKYLARPGYDFYFATTCNAASASLWKQLGGTSAGRSEIDYILPLRLDSLLATKVASRTRSHAAATLARLGGQCADAVLTLMTHASARLTVELCEDWDKLTELSRRHTPQNIISSERSANSLQWRYGPASPAHPCRIYLIRDTRGNEGWFALGRAAPTGKDGVTSCALLDAIWPTGKMAFRDLVPWIIRMAPESAEAVFVRCRPDTDLAAEWRWLLRRRLSGPRAYVIVPRSAPILPFGLMDYDDNDYVAWN